MFVVIIEVFIL